MSAATAASGSVVGVGIDMVDIGRFGKVLSRRPGIKERLFSSAELDYAGTLSNPVPTLAGRFAVKEAVMKALGVGIGAVDWNDISVSRLAGGAPELAVTGRAGRLALERGVSAWHVSISHTASLAAATVVAVT